MIGAGVSVGHAAVLHGCVIGDRTLIGLGSILMARVEIGEDYIVAADSLLLEGTVVPSRSLAAGSPARIRRAVTDAEVVILSVNIDCSCR